MDSDSETEEHQEINFIKGAVGRILLIDARDPKNSGFASRAIEAARVTFRNEMRIGGVRYTSVCFYNASEGVRGVFEILPLAAATMKDYKKLQAADVTLCGQASSSDLADAFWHCSRAFASFSRALGERSVVLLTKFDDPPTQAQQRPALKRAVDLANLGIDLHLVNLASEKYDSHPFYTELLQASANGRPGRDISLPEPVWLIDDIVTQIRLRSHRLAASAKLHFQLGGDIKLGVGVYNLTSKKDPPKIVKLTKDRNELVSNTISTVRIRTEPSNSNEPGPSHENTEREIPVLKSELIFYQCYGGKRIEFTKQELVDMKKVFGPPKITLLGFKPQTWLSKEKHFLKSCQFLFPDDRLIEGSTKAFRALHKACEERGVLAVCMMRTRLSSHPTIVALWPCTNPLGLNVDVGFDIIHIPYLENKKEVPDPENEITAENYPAEVDMMKRIASQLKFNFSPETFENPKLQSLYRAIEALALEEEIVEPLVDTTKPKSQKFNNLNPELFETVFGPFEVGSAKKRPANGGEPKPKRPVEQNFDMELLKSRLSTHDVAKYNVADLKKIIHWKNPPNIQALSGLRKDALVNIVYEYCNDL